MLTWIWVKYSLPVYNAWQEQDRTQVPEKMVIGAKHATICLLSCAVYYYIMPDKGIGLEERQQTVGPDIEILVVLMLVRLTWVLLILEIVGDGWRLSTGKPWSKNDGNIRSQRSKLSYLILRDVWFSSWERGFQMLIFRCYHAPGFQHAKYYSRS